MVVLFLKISFVMSSI